MVESESRGPLQGLVVLDLSRVLSGPYCTMMLRDLGATVIKVEQPGEGDEARHFLPLTDAGESAYFTAINRGKKSIALDLKSEGDQSIFNSLLARSNVLVENFRPEVLDLAAALFACNGIQAALLQRERTERGCRIDIAMLDAQIAILEGAIAELFCSGAPPGPIGARHPGAAAFDAFKAGDGYIVIAASSDHLFAWLTDALGVPSLFNSRLSPQLASGSCA